MKTLILGLGNPFLSDDGVGIRVAQELRKRLTDVDIIEASIAGISILDYIVGYDKLIVVDSIKTGRGGPGKLHKLNLDYFDTTIHLSSLHGVDFPTAIELGKKLGYKIPKIINIYAIEIEDNFTFNEKCTTKVEACIPKVVQQIINEIKTDAEVAL
ncbi:MAG TPA: hydrogenase maturation protease [bacterium (Candidatus Stahlbacteria)]|nr:hydrogenase maturation protease [Candidatus Stahlbacteria bacterium]